MSAVSRLEPPLKSAVSESICLLYPDLSRRSLESLLYPSQGPLRRRRVVTQAQPRHNLASFRLGRRHNLASFRLGRRPRRGPRRSGPLASSWAAGPREWAGPSAHGSSICGRCLLPHIRVASRAPCTGRDCRRQDSSDQLITDRRHSIGDDSELTGGTLSVMTRRHSITDDSELTFGAD